MAYFGEYGAAVLPLLKSVEDENKSEFFKKTLGETCKYAAQYPDFLRPALSLNGKKINELLSNKGEPLYDNWSSDINCDGVADVLDCALLEKMIHAKNVEITAK